MEKFNSDLCNVIMNCILYGNTSAIIHCEAKIESIMCIKRILDDVDDDSLSVNREELMQELKSECASFLQWLSEKLN